MLGNSLQCYTCTVAMKDKDCLQVTNCSSSEPYCETSVVNVFLIKLTNKQCSAACVSGNQNATTKASSYHSCCSSNLCNGMKIGDGNNTDFGNSASGLTSSLFRPAAIASILSAVLAIGI
ncbi:prostate stem cell antigen [Ascaphus truei]|uniref:prostate stem cell antigen n=1 Tax=Ascaphus truei TaxID=8439 RepID=UPI003F5AC605